MMVAVVRGRPAKRPSHADGLLSLLTFDETYGLA
jgi:hypothetical protein